MKFYTGRKPCGCVVAACVDSPEYKDDIKEAFNEWIEDGLTIEHVVSDEGPDLQSCHCDKPERCDKTVDMFEEAPHGG